MAAKEPLYDISSDDNSETEDVFGVSVDHFSNMFANIQQKVQEDRMRKPEGIRVVKKNIDKQNNVEEGANKSNEKPQKPLTKEEKIQQVLKEKEENMDEEERRLLAEFENFLSDGSPAPKTSHQLVAECVAVPDSPPAVLVTTSKRTRKGNAKSVQKPKKKKPADSVVPVEDSDTEEIEIAEEVPTTPTKFASIYVTWKDKTLFYSMNLYHKVSTLRQRVCKDTNVRSEDILIYFGEDILHDDKTLLDVGIKRGDTLEAMPAVRNDQVMTLDPALLKLKCQSQKRREVFYIHIRKTTSLHQLKKDIAQKISLGLDEFKLQFDGEQLDLDGTPESEGLENEDCIDIYT